jgi:pilus assembly protein Flp/PilA
MKNFSQSFKTFWADEDGATAIEYGLMAALIGIVMSAGATTLGERIRDLFTEIAGKLVLL